ncbi:hypothetical protein J2Y54_000528 [Sphingomonas sp. BE123]|uniref:hypothetical protein n=1 Tax=Sphingomonas sp. BE123 TaxID=2817842 RepID=UPI002864A583|nr:hypothetical protein [Sphingomonas sp. BE123]MDR6851035.1 hypothetical protein [Sphingomonas sp. BE123]
MIEVTQADRDAAATLAEALVGATNGNDQIARCRAGLEDNTIIVQALAAHRVAATPNKGGDAAALSDPNAVHVNMLRGSIAKPSPAQIWHIYGNELLADMPESARAAFNRLSGGD